MANIQVVTRPSLIEAAQTRQVIVVRPGVTINTGPGGGGGGGGVADWDTMLNKPSTFPPSAHGHSVGEVTGLQGALDGKQAQSAVLDATTASFTTADEIKLDGIAPGATANSSDATLLNRANHTGTQLAATISDATAAGLAMLKAATVAAQTALLDIFGLTTNGLVPAPTTAVGRFLRDDGTWAASPPSCRPNQFYEFDDGIGIASGDFWLTSVAGTGAALSQPSTMLDGGIGWVNMALGTTATGRAARNTNALSLLFGGGNEAEFGIRARLPVLSDATNTFTIRAGFLDSVTGESVDAVYFRYNHAVNGGRWEAVCRSNSVEATADTGITVAANTTYRLGCIINPAGNEAVFTINGSVVATITTNIPTSNIANRPTGFGIYCQRTVGTAAITALVYDYLFLRQSLPGRA